MRLLISFIAGILFSIGLLISGMANPEKVLNFLIIDKFYPNSWDPSLAFVMVGAIMVTAVMYLMIANSRITKPIIGTFHIPTNKAINVKLMVGAGLFGIGWGIAGICPGPAIVLLAFVPLKALYFFIPMVISMFFTIVIFRK